MQNLGICDGMYKQTIKDAGPYQTKKYIFAKTKTEQNLVQKAFSLNLYDSGEVG